MAEQTQFFYLLVKEIYERAGKQRADTCLRIVHWEANEEDDGHYVVYGRRTLKHRRYVPYRIRFETLEDVMNYIKYIFSDDCDMIVELHQFSGLNDDSEDKYNIDWYETAEDITTEIVAYDEASFDTVERGLDMLDAMLSC